MIRLTLWFSNQNRPQLTRTKFEHHLLDSLRVSVRGKSAGVYPDAGTFQWSLGVRALSLLFLRAASYQKDKSIRRELAILSGERNSLAQTLDYALSKQPVWLLDMFGWDSAGDSILRRMITRTNPGRNGAGPVFVSVRDSLLDELELKVFVDGQAVECSRWLSELAAKIEQEAVCSWHRVDQNTPVDSFESRGERLWKYLPAQTLNEVTNSLMGIDIFRRGRRNELFQSIETSELFLRTAGDATFRSELDEELSPSQSLGIADERSKSSFSAGDQQPLRVAIPIGHVGAMSVFRFLRHDQSYPLGEIDFYPHAVDITRRILNEDFSEAPDICSLSTAPAMELVSQPKKHDFRPLMLMPSISQQVLGVGDSKSAKQMNNGRYLFLNDLPSSELFYFEDLVKRGFVNRKKVSVQHLEPDESFSLLAEGDPNLRIISYFPHYHINSVFNDCSALDKSDYNQKENLTVLFVREALLNDREKATSLNIAIRNAWLTLRRKEELRTRVVNSMLSDNRFRTCVERFSGIY